MRTWSNARGSAGSARAPAAEWLRKGFSSTRKEQTAGKARRSERFGCSGPRSALVRRRGLEGLLDSRLEGPVERVADPRDLAVGADDEGGGDRAHTRGPQPGLAHRAVCVVADRVVHLVALVLDELLKLRQAPLGLALLAGGHADDRQLLVRLLQLGEMRDALAAGAAPGGP